MSSTRAVLSISDLLVKSAPISVVPVLLTNNNEIRFKPRLLRIIITNTLRRLLMISLIRFVSFVSSRLFLYKVSSLKGITRFIESMVVSPVKNTSRDASF